MRAEKLALHVQLTSGLHQNLAHTIDRTVPIFIDPGLASYLSLTPASWVASLGFH